MEKQNTTSDSYTTYISWISNYILFSVQQSPTIIIRDSSQSRNITEVASPRKTQDKGSDFYR